jgi:hypothetical protein
MTTDIEMTDFTKSNSTITSLPLSSSAISTTQLIQLSKNQPPSLVLKHCLYRSPIFIKKPALILFYTHSAIILGKEYTCTNISSMTIRINKVLYFLGQYAFTQSVFITTNKESENTLLVPYDLLQLTRWQTFTAKLCKIFTIGPILSEVGFLRELEVEGRRVLQKSFI